MKFQLSILIFFCFSSLSSFCQEQQKIPCDLMFDSNLFSFEGGQVEDLDSNLSFLKDDNYKINFDSLEIFEGKRSVRVSGLNRNAKTYATISLKVPLKIKKDSSIELTAWVKTDSLNGENSGAILRLIGYGDIKGGKPSVIKFSNSILKGSQDWTEISLSTILKEDSSYIILSGLMQGNGRAWFDNFNLTINEKKIDDILFFENGKQSDKIKNILNQYVTPLEITNLKQIGDFISNQNHPVKIIGLGEATHGTREVYNYKIEIIKSLIKNNGVRKVALEAYYANAIKLNNYILNGTGDIKKIIAELGFWPYYTSEFQEFMIWLKEHNKNNDYKISVIGVDSQPGGNSLEILTENLKDDAHFSKLLNELKNDTIEITLKTDISNTLFQELEKFTLNENILKNARILSQSFYLAQYKGLKYSTVRDSLMAVNIEDLENELAPDQKMVYWAHDLHIQKKYGWTGGFLNEKFGDKYMNLGFLLGNGKFTAIDKESRKIDFNNNLSPIKCNSLEALMDKYKFPVLLFKNNSALNNPYLKSNLFDKYLEKRSIGALEINEQFTYLGDNPGNLFNLLIYIKDSNPSKLLHK